MVAFLRTVIVQEFVRKYSRLMYNHVLYVVVICSGIKAMFVLTNCDVSHPDADMNFVRRCSQY